MEGGPIKIRNSHLKHLTKIYLCAPNLVFIQKIIGFKNLAVERELKIPNRSLKNCITEKIQF